MQGYQNTIFTILFCHLHTLKSNFENVMQPKVYIRPRKIKRKQKGLKREKKQREEEKQGKSLLFHRSRTREK